jgi:hypothetical protein
MLDRGMGKIPQRCDGCRMERVNAASRKNAVRMTEKRRAARTARQMQRVAALLPRRVERP